MNKILYIFLLLCLSIRCQYVNEYTSLTVPSFKVQDTYDSIDLSIMKQLCKMLEEKCIKQIRQLEFNKETNINQRYFLSRGPHEPPITCTPLCYAIYLSNIWQEQDKPKRGPFTKQNPYIKIIKLLLDKNANPNYDYPIFKTVATGNIAVFKLLLRNINFDKKLKYVHTNRTILEEIEVRLKKDSTNKTLQKMQKLLKD